MTLGEYRVGINFNPGKNPDVDTIKKATAALIDFCSTESDKSNIPEAKILWSLAMTHFENAAMWAVKAATKPEGP